MVRKKRSRKKSFKSTDKTLLIIIFLVAIILFAVVSDPFTSNKTYELEKEAKIIENEVLDGEVVDVEKLKEISEKEYEELKTELGVENDFLIHFENIDNEPIEPDGLTIYCIGSPQAEVKGVSCGK